MRVNYRERYDKLKKLVREKGTSVLREMYTKDELHPLMGSRMCGGESALLDYVTNLWLWYHSKASPDSELIKDQTCFLLDAFCAHREKHRWPISKSEGYRIVERANKAWVAKQRVRSSIQEVT